MLIGKNLPKIRSAVRFSSSKLHMITNPLPGSDIGIPLTLFETAYTSLHYGENLLTAKTILLQFLIGYYAYGLDRFNDAKLYQHKPYETSKQELYNYINGNSKNIAISLFLSKLLIYALLFDNLNMYFPFIICLETVPFYTEIKSNYGQLKAIYIATLWTLSAVILPCIIIDQNYDILSYPLDYIPSALTLFATSNIADNKDYAEDKENNILTLPVKYGFDSSNTFSLVALLCSSILIAINPHFIENQNIGSILEIQNAVISIIPIFI